MASTSKPLWRMGPIGWASSAIGIGLLIALRSGFDPLIVLLRGLHAVGDWPFMYWFVSRPWASMAYSVFDPVLGVFPLAGVIIATRIDPRPVARIPQVLLFVVGLIGSGGLISVASLTRQWFGMSADWSVPSFHMLTLAIGAGCTWWLFRSRVITLAFAASAGLPWLHLALDKNGLMGWIQVRPNFAYSIGVDFGALMILTCVVPIGWAIWYRRLPRGDHACRSCGYALAGLRDGDPCPECGESSPEAGNAATSPQPA